jgi:hemoglobin
MNALKRFAVLILLAVSVAACTSMQPEQKSLYDRLGGKDAITAVVQHLWGVVAKDARINGFFAHTKPDAFAGQLIDFLCQGTGGPCVYKGQDMVKAHVGMKISSADFDALAEDIVITLDFFKVPAKEKGEVMSLLGGMKQSVINH